MEVPIPKPSYLHVDGSQTERNLKFSVSKVDYSIIKKTSAIPTKSTDMKKIRK